MYANEPQISGVNKAYERYPRFPCLSPLTFSPSPKFFCWSVLSRINNSLCGVDIWIFEKEWDVKRNWKVRKVDINASVTHACKVCAHSLHIEVLLGYNKSILSSVSVCSRLHRWLGYNWFQNVLHKDPDTTGITAHMLSRPMNAHMQNLGMVSHGYDKYYNKRITALNLQPKTIKGLVQSPAWKVSRASGNGLKYYGFELTFAGPSKCTGSHNLTSSFDWIVENKLVQRKKKIKSYYSRSTLKLGIQRTKTHISKFQHPGNEMHFQSEQLNEWIWGWGEHRTFFEAQTRSL